MSRCSRNCACPGGANRWASLRPEAVRLVAPGVAPDHLTGRLTSSSFLGATTKLGIDLGTLRLHAVVPAGTAIPAIGEAVAIGFAPEALHLMEPA